MAYYSRARGNRALASRTQRAALWKMAYADFATAMMAFFMLLWLMSNSDKVSLQGLADYFAPSSATMSNSSGSGSILAGAALGPDGARASGSRLPDLMAAESRLPDRAGYGEGDDGRTGHAPTRAEAETAEQLRAALMRSPAFARAQGAVIVETARDGTRLHLTDLARQPLFAPGSAQPAPRLKALLHHAAPVLDRHGGRIAIEGHTDASGGHSSAANWTLSSRRADAARALLSAAGLAGNRIAEVSGKAGTAPLYPASAERAENRRITIVLIREAPVTPDPLDF